MTHENTLPTTGSTAKAAAFEDYVARLSSFKSEHGHFPTQSEDRLLYQWVANQRYRLCIGKLTDTQVQLLDSIGFIWNRRMLNWDEQLNKVKQELSSGVEEQEKYRRSYLWLSRQMQALHKRELSAANVQQLSELTLLTPSPAHVSGVWYKRWVTILAELKQLVEPLLQHGAGAEKNEASQGEAVPDEVFSATFSVLLKFKQRHQRFPTALESKSLYKWMGRQRYLKSVGQLDLACEAALNSINFSWRHGDDNWYSHYEEIELLLQDKWNKKRQPKELVTWFARQVECLLRNAMYLYRQQKLEQLIPMALPHITTAGTADKAEDLFAAVLEVIKAKAAGPKEPVSASALHQFNIKYGQLLSHLAVHKAFPTTTTNITLYNWLLQMRMRKHQGGLYETFEKRLNEIGFEWSPVDARRNRKYVLAKQLLESGVRGREQYKSVHGYLQHNALLLKRGKLTAQQQEKIMALLQPCPAEGAGQQEWDNNLEELVQAKASNLQKHLLLPVADQALNRLARWELRMQLQLRAGLLPPERIQQLRRCMRGNGQKHTFGSAWQQRYTEVQKFMEEHNAPPTFYFNGVYSVAHAALRRWLDRQLKTTTLTERQAAMIAALNVDNKRPTKTWDEKFKELGEHMLSHGTLPETPKLKTWLRKEEIYFRKGMLSPDKVNKLQALGVLCPVKTRKSNSVHNEKKWDAQLKAVNTFRKQHSGRWPGLSGSHNELRLYRWCTTQRQLYRQITNNGRNLPQHRIDKLNAAGFVWRLTAKKEQAMAA